jgi:uncharacterized metal-binding protein
MLNGCVIPIIGLICPRFLMFFILILTNWFNQAYETSAMYPMWPILGFLFMPYTALSYLAAMLNNGHQLTGGWIILVVVAVIFDLTATSRIKNID